MHAVEFTLKDETIEVKEIMDGDLPVAEKLDLLHKRYSMLVRDYKRIDRRLTEAQKKQLEVSGRGLCHVTGG